MTASKKQAIFEKISDVLSEYELTGITKNELVRILQEAGIASRVTFYEYFDEMADPKKANIIQMITPKGKINPICFPTPENQSLVRLKEKFKSIRNLLNLIKKYPELGDCFIPLPNLKKIHNSEKIPPMTGYGQNTSLYSDIIHSEKTSFGESNSYIILRSHMARHDLLKELGIFLTHYLNSPKRKHSKQIKEKCIKILTPTFLQALNILSEGYVNTTTVSKELKKTIQTTAPIDSAVFIGLVRAPTMPQVEVEFLKILGRYYYTISKRFTKNMELDSCREQKIISQVIRDFYCDDDEDDYEDVLDTQDIERILRLNDNFVTTRDKENEIKNEYGFDNSLAINLVKTFSNDEEDVDDALHIKIYYTKLFLSLGIFTKREQQIIEYDLKHDEEIFKSKEWIDPKEGRESLDLLFPNESSKYD
ncbi:hypothetical protein [Nitrosopumilus sp.]|uniref:hypothetical protein n=1 Tax=Nitrosopumilus sp. TaxID=2024843 RepID=UPI003D13CF58